MLENWLSQAGTANRNPVAIAARTLELIIGDLHAPSGAISDFLGSGQYSEEELPNRHGAESNAQEARTRWASSESVNRDKSCSAIR
jgi:hypothetical protein